MSTALDDGAKFGKQIVVGVNAVLLSAGLTDKERIEWWAGYVGIIMGAMCADVGTDATLVIGKHLQSIVEETARDHAH